MSNNPEVCAKFDALAERCTEKNKLNKEIK